MSVYSLVIARAWGRYVTPRIRCARCLPVIFRCCHVICLRIAFLHVIMCISFCIRVRLMHPVFFPLSVSQSDTPTCTRCTPLISFSEREKNILGMGRDLSSGLGTSPLDHLSNFVTFGGRLMPQRLTALTVGPISLCIPAPLHNSPLAHLNPLHTLRRWITIVWAKIAPHLDSPSSLHLYICVPLPRISQMKP